LGPAAHLLAGTCLFVHGPRHSGSARRHARRPPGCYGIKGRRGPATSTASPRLLAACALAPRERRPRIPRLLSGSPARRPPPATLFDRSRSALPSRNGDAAAIRVQRG